MTRLIASAPDCHQVRPASFGNIWRSLLCGTSGGRLIAGITCTVLAGLSVHVVLQQVLHVPFPSTYPVHAWPVHIDHAAVVLGLLLFLNWTRGILGQASPIVRWLVLFLLYAMLRETVRGALMEGIVTQSYGYPLLQLVPRVTEYLVLTLLCVSISDRLKSVWQYILASGLIYALMASAIQPGIALISQGMLQHFSYLSRAEVFLPPYGVHVLIPAYLTFTEPAVACVACAALVKQSMALSEPRGIIRFSVLMLLLRPGLFPPLINALYHPHDRLEAFLSAAQFSLETLALAIFSYLTWRCAKISRELEQQI